MSFSVSICGTPVKSQVPVYILIEYLEQVWGSVAPRWFANFTFALLSQERVSCDHLKGFWRNNHLLGMIRLTPWRSRGVITIVFMLILHCERTAELLLHNGVFARDATQLVTRSMDRTCIRLHEWYGLIGLLQGRRGNLQYTKTMRPFTWSSTWSQQSL